MNPDDFVGSLSVVGAGSWGTTLANLLAEKGYPVTLWGYESDLVERMQRRHENDLYLPGFALSENLTFTDSLHEAVRGKKLLLLVPPSQVMRQVVSQFVGELDDDVLIETRCTEMRAASCRMDQRALRGDTVLAEASFRVGFVAPGGRPRRQPEEWRHAFETFMNSGNT